MEHFDKCMNIPKFAHSPSVPPHKSDFALVHNGQATVEAISNFYKTKNKKKYFSVNSKGGLNG